jgi:hypothetical protein
MPFRDLVSRHAIREARRERISIDRIEETDLSPDAARASRHDPEREIRTRCFGDQVVEIVVDTIGGRVVTTWRKGPER